ncbi:MerR family transcriptional regulator [Companilactobacillus allii]|uniref:MerR family transcriptional regulator n=1 Tax=Companilactobacillus allii TaxID=1847728 RepID=A0A1P8Q1J1_9LACO|nr:MerR family transcriptional regulator [Companilactobacillus allii]APX71728.1 MerR family transcriptional regulator [Companilactobacillus allii]USQ68815.1 MerR family transcriptional regulator [Companilactobacillus allii]
MQIKDVAKRFDISADTLRYWERVGAIPKITRNSSGHRDYDQEDLEWVDFARCMRDAGVSIEYLIEYIDLFSQGDVTLQARKDLLAEQLDVIKAKRDEIQATYDKILNKVEHYEQQVEKYDGKLLKRN